MHQSVEAIKCEDGSNTLFSSKFNEPYHSTKDGAFHESMQKFVLPTISRKQHLSEIVILDICYGLGYNVLSTILYVKQHNIKSKIRFISVEFDKELIRSLADFSYPDEFKSLQPIIESISKTFVYSDDQFSIEILLGDARVNIPKVTQKVDIIYQDAFSPANNPLLWTTEHFATLRTKSKADTILATYSTAASVRLGLYESGFLIFVQYNDLARYSTIASPSELSDIEWIDMELKKQRNKESKSLKDASFIAIQ